MVCQRSRLDQSAYSRTVVFRALVVLTTAAALLVSSGVSGAQDSPPATEPSGHDHHHGHSSDERAPTATEQAAADRLVQATQAASARFADVAAAEAAGYHIVTPFSFYGARAAHFFNPAYALDGRLLDAQRPESLVYLKRDDGQLVLLGVMFVAPIGQGPAVGGPLTMWHTHDDLCAHPAGPVPSLPAGGCPDGARPLGFEMLHVWLVDHPEGPFADAPPPSAVTVPLGPWHTGGSLAAGAALVDTDALAAAVGEVLGLQPLEVGSRLAAGESLAEIAAAQGVPRENLTRVFSDRLRADYDRAVVVGDMTPGQRDLLVRTLPMTVDRVIDLHAGESWVIPSGGTPAATSSSVGGW